MIEQLIMRAGVITYSKTVASSVLLHLQPIMYV